MKQEESKIEITPLLEIIYELYKEDIKGGKLKVDLYGGDEQVVGKSAAGRQTFHQPALINKYR